MQNGSGATGVVFSYPPFAMVSISFLFLLARKGGKGTLNFLTGAYIEGALYMSVILTLPRHGNRK